MLPLDIPNTLIMILLDVVAGRLIKIMESFDTAKENVTFKSGMMMWLHAVLAK